MRKDDERCHEVSPPDSHYSRLTIHSPAIVRRLELQNITLDYQIEETTLKLIEFHKYLQDIVLIAAVPQEIIFPSNAVHELLT